MPLVDREAQNKKMRAHLSLPVMAASKRSVGDLTSKIEEDDAFVYVFDRREKDAPELKIQTGGLFSFIDFKQRVKEVLYNQKHDTLVRCFPIFVLTLFLFTK